MKKIFLSLLVLLALLLAVNDDLALLLTGGDVIEYAQLLKENHYQVIQWITDQYDINVYNGLNKGFTVGCVGVELIGTFGLFNACAVDYYVLRQYDDLIIVSVPSGDNPLQNNPGWTIYAGPFDNYQDAEKADWL